MTPLSRIKQAGFEVVLFGDAFKVLPESNLTTKQREFLRTHKAEIMNELTAANLRAEQAVHEIIRNLVTCYSSSGLCYEVEARDEKHAAWLKKMNPKPIGKQS